MRLRVRMKDPRDRYRSAYAPGIVPEYNEYEGEAVSRFPFLDENWFVLTTGDKESPYRMLHKDNVICGWLISNESSSSVIEIPGKNGRIYCVTISDDNSLSCNCTGFGYRKTCSHVNTLAKEVLENV